MDLHGPHKPVIISQLKAQEQADIWTKLHDFRTIEDSDGLLWNVHKELASVPDPETPKKLVYHLTLHIKSTPHIEDLIRTQTLSPEEDARLLTLLGEEAIPLVLKPQKIVAENQDELGIRAREFFLNLRNQFQSRSFHQTKRKLIGRWVEKRCTFATSQ